MSNASPQVVDYLARQLARNPITHSGEIVATRARAFKLTAAKADISQANNRAPTDRRHARVQLETIRGQCFAAPVGQLVSQLDELHLDDFPDLEALARRLRTILNCRGRLPSLSQHKDFDGDFFACLKKVLTSPSRDVSVLREQVLSSFRVRRNRRRGQAMVRLLKEELPELYALEADWLGSLLGYSLRRDYSPAAQTQKRNDEWVGAFAGWRWGAVIWAFILVVSIGQLLNIFPSGGPKSVETRPYGPKPTVTRPAPPSKVSENAIPSSARNQVQQRPGDSRRPFSSDSSLESMLDSRRFGSEDLDARVERMQREAEQHMQEFQELLREQGFDPQHLPELPGRADVNENPFDVPPISPPRR